MNIILLHGSWHGAWCWYKVIPILESMGHVVFAPDLPARGRYWRFARGRTTLNAMATHVCKLLDSLGAPALLVAHSRGGIVASTVAQRNPEKLHGIVYLAAYMLRNNERVIDLFRKDKTSLVPRNLHANKTLFTDFLDPSAYRDALYADCDLADIALANALLTPEPSLPALTRLRLSEEKYGSVKRHYIELRQDRAVSLELQRSMIAASPCASVHGIEASHSAYFSRPRELSEVIDTIISRA